jgi:hypothetical protein
MPCKRLDLIRIRKSGRWKINGFDILTVLDTSFVMLDLVSVVALLDAGPLSLQFVVRRIGSTATFIYVDDA